MDWPTERTAIPLSEQGMINAIYTATCRTPADPMIVWGTQIDVGQLGASLNRLGIQEDVVISPAHALLWSVARSLVEHPDLNLRVIGRRVHHLRDVNLLIPILDRKRGQVEVVLMRRMQHMSLGDVARALWKETHATIEKDAVGNLTRSSWKNTRWGLRFIHKWVSVGFRINNRIRMPNLGFNDEFNSASGLVNYFGFPNAPLMTSYKPSCLPANLGLLNVTMGPGRQQPVVDRDRIVIRKLAPLFVRFDHRIGYVHQFAELISTLQRHLQNLGNATAITALNPVRPDSPSQRRRNQHRPIAAVSNPPEFPHGPNHCSCRQGIEEIAENAPCSSSQSIHSRFARLIIEGG